MTRQRISLCAVMLMALMTFPGVAWGQDDAPDPLTIAQRCVAAVTAKADHCISANHATARRAVTAIEDLLANGDRVGAKRVAYRASMNIIDRSNVCVARIHRVCRKCVRVLHRLGADVLARRVYHECHDQIHRVRRSQAMAIKAIRAALAQGADDDAS